MATALIPETLIWSERTTAQLKDVRVGNMFLMTADARMGPLIKKHGDVEMAFLQMKSLQDNLFAMAVKA